jgi:hypothetical protein
MAVAKQVNLAVSFLLEISMLAAFAYWGFHAAANPWLRWLLAIAAPAAAVIVWGLFLAPKARRRVASNVGIVVSFGMFFLAAAGLFVSNQPIWGAAMLIVAAINRALAVVWKQW